MRPLKLLPCCRWAQQVFTPLKGRYNIVFNLISNDGGGGGGGVLDLHFSNSVAPPP